MKCIYGLSLESFSNVPDIYLPSLKPVALGLGIHPCYIIYDMNGLNIIHPTYKKQMIGLSEGRETRSSLWSCFQLLLPTTFLLNLCQQCQVCLFSRFLMNSIEHPFSFLQYAKQLILNYFFHSVAWLFCIMKGGLVESYNQKTTHIIRKKKKNLFSSLKK